MKYGQLPHSFIAHTDEQALDLEKILNVSALNGSLVEEKELLQELLDIPLATFLGIILGSMIIFTIIGNLFVIIAIVTERHLRRPQNYLIISLAIADMTVGLAVLPLSAMYEITKRRWMFGATLCEVWIFTDVTACSASILNLVAIAIDRYWSITNVRYSQQRKTHKLFAMIAVVWIISFLISILPIVGWKDHNYHSRIENKICLISQEPGFQIFSTTTAFYAPLILIITLYGCIWKAAKKRIRKRSKPSSSQVAAGSSPRMLEQNDLMRSTISLQSQSPSYPRSDSIQPEYSTALPSSMKSNGSSESNSIKLDESSRLMLRVAQKSARQKRSLEMKRERKAFHTLAIITGTFIICWLPFFVTALLRALCGFSIPDIVDAVFVWLGWSNSLLNPVIYTIFAPDFRNAFRKILRRLTPCQFVKQQLLRR